GIAAGPLRFFRLFFYALFSRLLSTPLFHVSCLFVAIGDPAPRQVVGRQIDRDAVALEDPDVVLAHLAAYVGQHFVPVLELHPERRVGEHLRHGPHHLDGVTGHLRSPPPAYVPSSRTPGASKGSGTRVHRRIPRRLRPALDVRGVSAASLAGERDALGAELHIPPAPPPRHPHDRAGATGRADQRGVLPVRRNQGERFGRPVFLNPPSPHGLLAPPYENVVTPGRPSTEAALTPCVGGVSLTTTGGCHGPPRVRAPGRDCSGRGEPVPPGLYAHRPGPRSRRLPHGPALRDAARRAHPRRPGGAPVSLRPEHLAAPAPGSRERIETAACGTGRGGARSQPLGFECRERGSARLGQDR